MFTDNQLRVLALLMSQPDKEYYLSELGEMLGKKPGIFQRGINSLDEQGIVRSRRRGNLRFFSINREHTLYPEIKRIVEKTVGVEGLLRKMFEGMDDVAVALIYGSYAKDTMRADSDIDLVIVGKSRAETKLLREIKKIEKSVDREINFSLYTKKEFAEKRRKKDAFLEEVLSDKYILLKGTLNV
jgi:predicted nucleotidyltransferase